MTTPNQTVEELRHNLEASLKPFIFDQVTSDTLDKVKEAISDQLRIAGGSGAIQPKGDITVYNLWMEMSFKEKVQWFLANRIVPWVGRQVRKTHELESKLNALQHEFRAYRQEHEPEPDQAQEESWGEDEPMPEVEAAPVTRDSAEGFNGTAKAILYLASCVYRDVGEEGMKRIENILKGVE